MPGQDIILWSIRAACASYVLALIALRVSRHSEAQRGEARLLWTAGCLLYLVHVWSAFEYKHAWSHAKAVEDTARQTADMSGVNWGGGVWFNYVFTLIWSADVIWWWRNAAAYQRRARWLDGVVHGYLAFMFFNGAVVFAKGPSRIVNALAAILLAIVWLSTRARQGLTKR
ncbi:MAG: hypothetical protein JNL98_38570 [Bryobacterales bacterium]|nr:hypothetical protein [Bryobacterales bacterium]